MERHGSRDVDGAQLGCWRERGSVSDQLLATRGASHLRDGNAVLHHSHGTRNHFRARAGDNDAGSTSWYDAYYCDRT